MHGLTGTEFWQSSRALLQSDLTANDFEGCFCFYMVVIRNREGTLFYKLRRTAENCINQRADQYRVEWARAGLSALRVRRFRP